MNGICIYCKSKSIVKFGKRKTKERGRIQRYLCKLCKRTFCEDDGFKWKHYSPSVILDALELFVGGLTLRFLDQFMSISKDTILRWIFEYVTKLDGYIDRFKQKMTDMLHMDELFLKERGGFDYLWASICRDTRFSVMILAPRRTEKYAMQLLNESPSPVEVTTDGAFNYMAVIRRKFGTWWYHHFYHRCKDFEDKKNNNLIERLNNFFRSKTHQRRGFNSLVTGQLQVRLIEIYYNFVRKHSTIGMTPAEKAGLIEYFGCKNEKSKWRFLIKQATHSAYFCLTLYINRICRQSRFHRYPTFLYSFIRQILP